MARTRNELRNEMEGCTSSRRLNRQPGSRSFLGSDYVRACGVASTAPSPSPGDGVAGHGAFQRCKKSTNRRDCSGHASHTSSALERLCYSMHTGTTLQYCCGAFLKHYLFVSPLLYREIHVPVSRRRCRDVGPPQKATFSTCKRPKASSIMVFWPFLLFFCSLLFFENFLRFFLLVCHAG